MGLSRTAYLVADRDYHCLEHCIHGPALGGGRAVCQWNERLQSSASFYGDHPADRGRDTPDTIGLLPTDAVAGKACPRFEAALNRLKPAWWIAAVPPIIAAGYLVSKIDAIAWLLLPPLHVLAVGVPIAWMLYLGIRALPKGSSQRLWGVFDSGMVLSPILIMVLEILSGIGLIIVFAIYLSSQPGMLETLMKLANRLRGLESQEAVFSLLSPYLTNPLVIAAGVLFAGVIVPAIEELIKPIGVWLLAGRKITPAAGFAAGALCGAGYGFIESLTLSGSGDTWTALVVARIGTAGVHILTTALTGWAIVQIWQGKRYGRFLLAYFCSVLIHGLWNSLTVLYSFKALAQMQDLPLNIPMLESIAVTAPVGLVIIAAGCFLGLIEANRYLRKQHTSHPSLPTGAGLPEQTRESML